MTTPDQFLDRFSKFGIRLGLERIYQQLSDLGNPHTQVPAIHVAGTNGKGSVCAYISSILQAAGYRVGRYISPHLVNWRERISINSQWISDRDLMAALQQVERTIVADRMPTQFEVVTAAAWWYFAQQKVDVAVIETGLGGRLDATNVCDRPLAAVITSISMDHWQRLGNTLGAIAGEKAGIIKFRCPAIIGEVPEEAKAVIAAKINDCEAVAAWVKAAVRTENGAEWEGFKYPLPLLGKHQLMNSAIALATIRSLQKQGWQISESAIVQGMSQTQWAGRLQWVEYQSHKLLIDGAHNVEAALCLRQFVDEAFPQKRVRWIVGILTTKDSQGILQAILHPDDLLFTVPVPAHQTTDPEKLANLGDAILIQPPTVCQDLPSALDAACRDRNSDPVILCGSLYLVGEMLKICQ
ncbi:bifunctional folylpolyglutamate synthase/dihydrofolate synthase [Pseudanabaena sp. PCC 6802]|uniref:bifunctional folylpolyglutamate synthase/dihydrofolate synthase n=1 Tax=Pseudanabaena sp. PCC 6802 TaxID=118173 RepID=UPI00034C3EA3|nr:folylpolyglutamate synthase/dihydrofolate synthase family protein [Pseudanabaena sp. PCC 6802]